MKTILNYNNTQYTLNIDTLEISLSILIKSSKHRCVVIYIPYGDKRFDYNIVSNSGLDIETIENILELFTEQEVR